MGVLDVVARNLASSMARTFGQTTTLTAYATAVYSTTNVAPASRVATEYNVEAIVAEYSQGEIQGLIKQGDKKVLIAAKDLTGTPDVSWTVSIGGVQYTIRHVRMIFSGDQIAMYELTARGP